MSLSGVLLSCAYPGSKENSVCSGVLFADEWVLTLGTILDPAVNKDDTRNDFADLFSDSSDRSHVNIIPSSLRSVFASFQFKAVIENDDFSRTSRDAKKSTPMSDRGLDAMDSPSLVLHKWKTAQLVAMWRCPLVADAVDSVLYDWTLSPGNQKDRIFEKLLSSFLVFRIGDGVEADITLSRVMAALGQLERQIEEPRRGEEIVIESTLFGREFFLNSQSQGIISNRLGKQGCLLLTDARSAIGCEGGPIFARRERTAVPSLLGLVLSSISWWKGEWVGFTLGVALQPILTRLRSEDSKSRLPRIIKSTKNLDHIDKSIVLVRCGADWGSGVVVDKSLGLVLTCSHVVKRNSPITVAWGDATLAASLVYRTRDGVAYDVAVLRVAAPPPGMQQASVSTEAPVKGEKVFVVGFPMFSKHSHHRSLLATATRGIVSHVAPPLMLQTTCCVQSGASGGAVMREDGVLLGLVSCNAHDIATGALFPHVNMAVPAMAFVKPLLRYCQTLDAKTLCALEEQDEHVQKMWKLNFTKCKL